MKYRHKNEGSALRRYLRSPFTLVLGLLLVGFLGWSLIHEVSNVRRSGTELELLRNKITAMEEENNDYTELISRLGTDGFVEREARLKLGYQYPNERVLLIRDPVKEDELVKNTLINELSNPQKWWRYFFDEL